MDNYEARTGEKMLDDCLHKLESEGDDIKELCKPIREAQGKIQDKLKEKYPDAEWDFC